jgi:tellurite resistance protein TehA-like permease
VVAATGILGSQWVQLSGAANLGLGLWVAGLVLWFGLTYTVLPLLMEGRVKPALEHGVNGGWLLTVVSTQAVCVLGCQISAGWGAAAVQPLLFTALAFWLLGGMLYGRLIALIFYRCLFLPLPQRELTPAYWINMGAMAISTLAGVSLVDAAGRLELLTELLPFLKGVTLLFWATATWWIPMLLALDGWRHFRKHFPLVYGHDYWEIVFPLGMYAVCTQELARVFGLPFLAPIPAVFVWAALLVWAATFAGLVHHLAEGTMFSRRNSTGRAAPQSPMRSETGRTAP